MKNRFVLCLIVSSFLLGGTLPLVAQSSAGTGAPKVIFIEREEIKPGNGAAHAKMAESFAKLYAKAKSPGHWLGLLPISGNENEAIFMVAYPSFEAMENDRMEMEKKAGAEMEKIDQAYPGMHTSQRILVAVLRPDLSYHADQISSAGIGELRYINIKTFRTRPGREAQLREGAKTYYAAMEKANYKHPIAFYQVVAGASSGTFLSISGMQSMKEMDVDFNKAIMDALGEDELKKLTSLEQDMNLVTEANLYYINPQMSYVSQETASVAPDFWTPKPVSAAKTAAKSAAKEGEKK
jgi:hypothetical protein